MTAAAGLFVVVEGPEGAGKSTLVRALAARLAGEGRDVVAVREPGGTPLAEAARRLALEGSEALPAAVELFLVLAARADLVARVIRPALEAGRIVLADRFELSTMAYQVAGRGLPGDAVAAAARVATGGLVPDLVLVLDVPPALGLARQHASGKTPDRFEREDGEFHERVAATYRRASGPGVVHLDAGVAASVVAEAAWREVVAALTTPSMRGST
jgi:dTMP kinase